MCLRRAFQFFLLLAVLLAGPASPAGPIRNLGPEGYVSALGELRFPSPQDSGHMLARTAHDLWESRDGGASWRSLLAHLPFGGQLGRLAIDPFDKAHWLIAAGGAGEPQLFETRDGGRTWSIRTLPGLAYTAFIVFDDRVTGRVMLSENITGTFLLSRDGGVTWEGIPIPSPPYPAFPPLLLAARQSQFYFNWLNELWSYDAGTGTWRQVSDGAVGLLSELWPDATSPNIFFARYSDNLFRSNDGGRTFSKILDTGGGDFDFQQSLANPSHLAILAWDRLHLSLDRGSSWTSELVEPISYPSGLAFDPVDGGLVLPENEALVRRHTDGRRSSTRPRGLFAVALADFHVDPVDGPVYAVSFGGAFYRRGTAGRWHFAGQTGCGDPKRISVTPWSPERIYLTCGSQEFLFSDDGGASWTSDYFPGLSGGLPNRIVLTPGDPGRTFILAPQFFIRPIEPSSEFFPYIADVAVHPEASRGMIAVAGGPEANGALFEWTPASGWQKLGFEFGSFLRFLAQDPRQPEHLLAISEVGESSVSFDRGRTWEARGAIPPVVHYSELGIRPAIDPNDSSHMAFSGAGSYETYESRDGAESWQQSLGGFSNYGLQFDGQSNLLFASNDGLRMRSEEYRPCAGQADNFCARQGRFEMTVDWKTPNGNSGVAKKVVTGSEESGLFYFFDANNWELLVKVLDGCAINQRFWVFTAGTTDVEYLLKVEDLLTGKVRTYFNQGGQAAGAIGDIDAFATCEASPAPASAPAVTTAAMPAGDRQEGPGLELLGGRFVVKTSWTNFAGQDGFGTPTPLRSANSGLFWFFSPDNWEVLVKVLDGCAINGHYWVLAAATTDVGYEIEVSEPGGGPPRTYTNPVGRPSPAQIDLAAFACRG